MQFKGYDRRIKYYPLYMRRRLDNLPSHILPEGFSFSFYSDEADIAAWREIEISAGECLNEAEAESYWRQFFEARKAELPGRMVFIENSDGEKVATATMLYDINAGDDGKEAWLHWVAIKREYQGRGLSKPLISRLLKLMAASGYGSVKLSTHTWANRACKIYMDLLFRPCEDSLKDCPEGWRIIKTLTSHSCLSEIKPYPEGEIPLAQDLPKE